MELGLYYTTFLPALLPFVTGQGQLTRLNDNRLSDKEILDAVSDFFAKALAGIRPPQPGELPIMIDPVYTSAHIQIVVGAELNVQAFLNNQGVIASNNIEELTTKLRDWYTQFAASISDIYKSYVLSVITNSLTIPITFPANIKKSLLSFAKLYANEDIICEIPITTPDVALEWNDNTANTVITESMRNANIFTKQYVESGFVRGGTIGNGNLAIPSSDTCGYNLLMVKNLSNNLYLPIAYVCFKEVGNVKTPIRFDSFELYAGVDPFTNKISYTIYGYINPADITNDECTLITLTREYIANNPPIPTPSTTLPVEDRQPYISLPYDDTFYYRNPQSGAFTKGGLLNTNSVKYDFLPNSEYGVFLGTISLDTYSGFFNGTSDIYDMSNYVLGTYIRNNVNIEGETYTYPVTLDPNIKQKLISDEYDIIGSGNSTDASARSDEGVTIVVDPASVGLLSDVYPVSDVLAEAVNVYPVDLANDKTIADNPAEAISIPDAAIAIETANENSGAAVGVSPLELVSATGRYGMFTIYKVTISQLTALSSKLWSEDFLDNFHPFKNNPSEALISLMAYPMDINSSGSDSPIICGNYDCSPASGKVVNNLFNTKTLGSVNIPLTFNNFLDYSPYTTVNLFLPFIGFVELDVDEVMGANISVFYRVEVITGTCVAYVKVKKGTMDAILYQYAGNMGITLPLSGSDFSRVYSLLATASVGVLGSVLGAGALTMGATAGFAGQAVASKPPVHKTGSLSGNSGMCGNLVPYVVINTVIPDTPDGYKALKGKPTNKYLRIGDLQGFVQLDRFYLNIPNITDEERIELDVLLKEGIFV